MTDEFETARLLAAFNVFARHNFDPSKPDSPQPSPDYLLRRIQRACCRILCSPIEAIERMPLETMLAHYYEHVYDELSEGEGEEAAERWREEIAMLAETDQERAKRIADQIVDSKETEDFIKETGEMNERGVKIQSRQKTGDVDLEDQARRLQELAKRTGAKMGISRKY